VAPKSAFIGIIPAKADKIRSLCLSLTNLFPNTFIAFLKIYVFTGIINNIFYKLIKYIIGIITAIIGNGELLLLNKKE